MAVDTAAPSPARVQAWIASHLLEPRRLRALELAVRSLAAQSEPLEILWISMSAAPAVPFPTTEEIALWAGGLPVRALRHPARRLQFEHLRAIWGAARGAGPPWVMFCDDDDLCGPDRVRNFRAALEAHPDRRFFRTQMCAFADEDGELTADFADALAKAAPDAPVPEFGAHICHTSILDAFFEHHYESDLRLCGGVLDVLFVGTTSWESPPTWAAGVQYAYRMRTVRGLLHDYGDPPGSQNATAKADFDGAPRGAASKDLP